MRSETKYHIGTSGWAYDEWKTHIYADVSQSRFLRRYSELFSTVEVNYTYRRDLSERTAQRWLDQTPEDFRFVVKAHQRATHFNRLRNASADIATQVEQLTALGDRLGLVYFQLPRNFVRNDDLLTDFLDRWPSGTPIVWEFLHGSWHVADVHQILMDHNVGWVNGGARQGNAVSTSPHTSFRLRQETYTNASLGDIASDVRRTTGTSWVFVRHGEDAPLIAQQLQEMLGDS